MLEWYETGKTYIDLIYFLKDLLLEVVTKTKGTSKVQFKNSKIDFAKGWKVFTVKEAFLKFTGITPEEAIAKNEFEILLTEKVEPNLPKGIPVILKDYPTSMAALSKINEKDNVAERWELYLGGIEIANAYSELTDYNEQKKRFKKVHKNREKNKLPAYPDDKEFFKCLEYGIASFAGCALGVDRLVMVLTNSESIKKVNYFTEF
jgi:lysyl-tRNA synthetase class 2